VATNQTGWYSYATCAVISGTRHYLLMTVVEMYMDLHAKHTSTRFSTSQHPGQYKTTAGKPRFGNDF